MRQKFGWFGGGVFLLLFSCGLLQQFLPDFLLINWIIFFLINSLGQSFYPHFKKNKKTLPDQVPS
jgi:hypothetical protein